MDISWMDLHKTWDNGFQPVANITIRPSGFLPVPCIAHLSIYCFLVSLFLICKKLTSWCKLSYTIMNFYEIHTNHIKSIHIINKKQICPVWPLGYCPVRLLSDRATIFPGTFNRATIPQTNVQSSWPVWPVQSSTFGYSLVGLLSAGVVF